MSDTHPPSPGPGQGPQQWSSGQAPYGQPYGHAPYPQQPAYGQAPYGQQPPPGGPGWPTFTPLYAHWIKRVAATLLDGLILAPFYILAATSMALAMSGMHTQTTYLPDGSIDATTVGHPNWALFVVAIVAYLAVAALSVWNQWIRQGRTGWSLGKQWMGIRVVRDGLPDQPPGIGLNIGRAFAHILDGLACYIGYLWPLWDGKNQTFADKLCSTVVIEQRRVRQG